MKTSVPKMTINVLGDFLVSKPHQQRKLLEALKYPKENKFRSAYYEEARRGIKDYFLNGFDEEILFSVIAELEEIDPSNDYQESRLNNNIASIDEVLESDNVSTISEKFEFEAYSGNNEKVVIEGVEISVYPDLIIKSNIRGSDYFGALKIFFSKKENDDVVKSQQYVAAMLHHYASNFIEMPKGFSPRNANSISYDVFADSFIESPAHVKTKFRDIEAGCKNIAAIWDSI